MTKLNVTPGPWAVEGLYENFLEITNGEGLAHAYALPMQDEREREGNAALIAEAGTVYHETGLTPRQLAESHAELLAALEGALVLLERLGPDTERKLPGGSECSIGHYASYHVEVARAAIARATGTTTKGE